MAKLIKKYWCKLCSRYHKDRSVVKLHEVRLKKRIKRVKGGKRVPRVKKEQTLCPLCGKLHRVGSKRLILHTQKASGKGKSEITEDGIKEKGKRKHKVEGIICELCGRFHKKGSPQIEAHAKRLEKRKARLSKKEERVKKKIEKKLVNKELCPLCKKYHKKGSSRLLHHIEQYNKQQTKKDKVVEKDKKQLERELKREQKESTKAEKEFCTLCKRTHRKGTKLYLRHLNQGYIEGHLTEHNGKESSHVRPESLKNWCVICSKDHKPDEMSEITNYCKECDKLINDGDVLVKQKSIVPEKYVSEWYTMDEFNTKEDIDNFDKWASKNLENGTYKRIKISDDKFIAIVTKRAYKKAMTKYNAYTYEIGVKMRKGTKYEII